MDLSQLRFDRHTSVTMLPSDVTALLATVTARQAASPTATAYAGVTRASDDAALFAPVDGAFNGPVATTLMKWKEG